MDFDEGMWACIGEFLLSYGVAYGFIEFTREFIGFHVGLIYRNI